MDIIRQLLYKHEALFEWQDGPLVIFLFIPKLDLSNVRWQTLFN
jgi:hypothetical protein